MNNLMRSTVTILLATCIVYALFGSWIADRIQNWQAVFSLALFASFIASLVDLRLQMKLTRSRVLVQAALILVVGTFFSLLWGHSIEKAIFVVMTLVGATILARLGVPFI
jgi:hypothetical protein